MVTKTVSPTGFACKPAVRRQRLPCKFDGCESISVGRGFCDKHYRRFLKYGDPAVGGFRPLPSECEAPDCSAKPVARFENIACCIMHWNRMRKRGTLELPDVQVFERCCADDCFAEPSWRGSQYCSAHYSKWKRHGDPNFKRKLKHSHGDIIHDSLGYLQIYLTEPHPLKNNQNNAERVFHHRYVLFNAVGGVDQDCHWCGRRLKWKTRSKSAILCVDHLDDDKWNNDPENLVPSCVGCNNQRGAFMRWVNAHVDDPYLLSRLLE